jgi:peptidoglycan/LPS O-acetylase OafA/YrhL
MDALRAIAALSIVMFHYAGYVGIPSEMEFARPLIVRLGAGVLVFFVISGFLLYRPFVRANLAGSDHPELGGYAKRRFLRVVPAFFLALTVTGALVGKTDVFGENGFFYFGFLQIYKPGLELRGLSVAWSLCIEVTLYAFLPVFALLVAKVPAKTEAARHRRELTMLGLLLLIGVASRIILSSAKSTVGDISILAYLDIFAVGMFMAYLSVALEGKRLPPVLAWLDDYPGISWGLAAVCFGLMAWATGPNRSAFQHAGTFDIWFRHSLSAGLGAFLVLPVAFGDQTKGTLRRVLAQPWILWAGVVSYGIYLFHPVVLRVLSDAGLFPDTVGVVGWFGLLLVAMLVTGAVAAASWHFFERPLIGLKNAKLLSTDRPALPQGSRIAIGIGGIALAVTGIIGSEYVFVDFVMIAAGVILALAALLPSNQPRPAAPFLAGVGAIAVTFALIPGILTLSAPARAGAATTAFPQRAYLAGTVGGGKIKLYLNGKLVGEGPAPKDLRPSRNEFEIGGVTGGHGWNGAIDSVGVWNEPLSETALRNQFKLGSSGKTTSLQSVMTNSGELVRWYRLGDVRTGAKDPVGRTTGRNIGAVGQSLSAVASGDKDAGAAKFVGTGRISTPPLLRVSPSNFTVGAWVQSGESISDRTIAGVQDAWLLKTDVSGHWTFGVKEGKSGYTVTSTQAAQRYVPGQATQAQASSVSSGVSIPGLIAGLLVVIAGLLLIPSVRRRVLALFSPQAKS